MRVRAFSTQLLCEQVIGRALRRMSYAINYSGHFDPEYADNAYFSRSIQYSIQTGCSEATRLRYRNS
jgi:hypothetical protein